MICFRKKYNSRSLLPVYAVIWHRGYSIQQNALVYSSPTHMQSNGS